MSRRVDDSAESVTPLPLSNYMSMMKGNDPFIRVVVLIIACHVLGIFDKASTAMC